MEEREPKLTKECAVEMLETLVEVTEGVGQEINNILGKVDADLYGTSEEELMVALEEVQRLLNVSLGQRCENRLEAIANKHERLQIECEEGGDDA